MIILRYVNNVIIMNEQNPLEGKKENPMRKIRIEKVSLSMGTGTDMDRLDKGMKLLQIVSGKKPVKTLAKKRIPTWSIRPGLPIGCKVTLRGKEAEDKLRILLKAVDDKLSLDNFDEQGNFSFGIKEYIDLPNMDYIYELGILGFQVSVTLSRQGYRVKERKYLRKKIGKSHVVSKQEGIEFMRTAFNVNVE
ncbi:MAG: large subunit ribosomal protein [Candidatus Woesearchaeota archaeon]|nr:large subunit ribosomal protein [Candidatus Woesearchaeota archaeon]